MRAFAKVSFAAVTLSMLVTARATTLMRMSLAQLAQASQEIVRAKCVENNTAWDAGEIWTLTTFEVEETWRGSVSRKITVRLLGGRTAQFTSRVSGVPRFHPGEEVVLFLERTTRGDYSVVSWQQGTFRIQHVADSGEAAVTQDTAAFETLDPATHRFSATRIRRMRITDFHTEVEAAVGNAAKSTR